MQYKPSTGTITLVLTVKNSLVAACLIPTAFCVRQNEILVFLILGKEVYLCNIDFLFLLAAPTRVQAEFLNTTSARISWEIAEKTKVLASRVLSSNNGVEWNETRVDGKFEMYMSVFLFGFLIHSIIFFSNLLLDLR